MADNDSSTPRRIPAGVTGKQSAKAKQAWTDDQRKQFMDKAPNHLIVKVNGLEMLAVKQQFKTGSVGYYLTGKLPVEVDGQLVQLQAGFNLTAIGSRPGEA